MRITIATAILLMCPALGSAQPPAKKPTTVTYSGCVAKSETATNLFTLTEGSEVYRLSGLDVRDYVGRKVEVATATPRRLVIKGGLFPSANVAAQAGAMDPSKAATAATDASAAARTGQLPEIRVRSIKPVSGSCP